MKASALLLGIACLLGISPAMAGAVYRCDSDDGGRSYVSKRVAGARCNVVSQYRAAPYQSPARGVTLPASSALGVAVSATTASGSPASINDGAPATFGDSPEDMQVPSAPSTSTQKLSNGGKMIRGQVYSYVQDGVRHYTSKKPQGLANATALRTIQYTFMETCFACGAKPGVNFGKIRLNIEAYRDDITAASAQYGVDEAIVRAIIHAESAFNANALSRVGAQGLMQLMPATAKRFGVSNAFDPSQNIRGGVRYLGWLLKRFNGDLTLAAAGYNAGEGAVDKYKGVPPYSETRRYVERVNQLADRYRGGPVNR